MNGNLIRMKVKDLKNNGSWTIKPGGSYLAEAPEKSGVFLFPFIFNKHTNVNKSVNNLLTKQHCFRNHFVVYCSKTIHFVPF